MSIDDLLQAIMGNATSTKKGGIAEQTGLSAGLAQSAVALVMGKLLAGNQPDARPAAAAEAGEFTSGVEGAGIEVPSLGALLERMRSQGAVDETSLRATGLPQELAAKAGIDLPQAIKAIEAILGLLTGKQVASTTKRRKAASTKSATKPAAKAKAKAATKSKATAKAKSTTATKPKATAKSATKAKPKAAAKPKTTAKSTTKAKPKAAAKPKATPKSATKTKPKTAAKPKAASKSKAKAKTATTSGNWTVTG